MSFLVSKPHGFRFFIWKREYWNIPLYLGFKNQNQNGLINLCWCLSFFLVKTKFKWNTMRHLKMYSYDKLSYSQKWPIEIRLKDQKPYDTGNSLCSQINRDTCLFLQFAWASLLPTIILVSENFSFLLGELIHLYLLSSQCTFSGSFSSNSHCANSSFWLHRVVYFSLTVSYCYHTLALTIHSLFFVCLLVCFCYVIKLYPCSITHF